MGGGGVDWQDVGCVTVAACDLFGTPPSLVEHFPIESFPSCLLDDSTQSKINNTLSKRVGRLAASDLSGVPRARFMDRLGRCDEHTQSLIINHSQDSNNCTV